MQVVPLTVVFLTVYMYEELWDGQDLVKGMNCKHLICIRNSMDFEGL